MCFRLTLQWNRCDWSCIQPYISAMDKTSSNWGIREGWGAAEHHPNAGYRLLLDLSLLPVKVPSDSVKAEPQAAADCFGKQKGLEWKLVKKTWKETTQGFIEHSFKGKWFRLLVGVKENTNNWSWVFFFQLCLRLLSSLHILEKSSYSSSLLPIFSMCLMLKKQNHRKLK